MLSIKIWGRNKRFNMKYFYNIVNWKKYIDLWILYVYNL